MVCQLRCALVVGGAGGRGGPGHLSAPPAQLNHRPHAGCAWERGPSPTVSQLQQPGARWEVFGRLSVARRFGTNPPNLFCRRCIVTRLSRTSAHARAFLMLMETRLPARPGPLQLQGAWARPAPSCTPSARAARQCEGRGQGLGRVQAMDRAWRRRGAHNHRAGAQVPVWPGRGGRQAGREGSSCCGQARPAVRVCGGMGAGVAGQWRRAASRPAGRQGGVELLCAGEASSASVRGDGG